jgi:drug/metabolite transporter (DMT)-like permease
VPARARAFIGVFLLLASLACFAVLDTSAKLVTVQVPLLMAIWARYLVQAVASTLIVLPLRKAALLRTEAPRMHVVRGLLLVVVTALAFLSLKFLPVGEFTAIVMTTPLLVTLLAGRLLGERVSPLRLVLVAGGFAGTLLIVRPGSNALGWAMLLPLGLVIANAAFQLLTSKMARTEDAMTTQFYTSWIGTALATLPLLWFWSPVTSIDLWLGLLIMGLSGALGHFLFILAFERSPAATLMPYMYAQIGFAMVGGWMMFDHVPDHLSLAGMVVIAGCGVAGGALTLKEARMRQTFQSRICAQ